MPKVAILAVDRVIEILEIPNLLVTGTCHVGLEYNARRLKCGIFCLHPVGTVLAIDEGDTWARCDVNIGRVDNRRNRKLIRSPHTSGIPPSATYKCAKSV